MALRAIISGAALLTIIVAGCFWHLTLPLNHDVAWLLQVSEEVLGGAELYVDVSDPNPPLIFWLGIPVIWLERLTGISRVNLYPVLIALGAVASLLATARVSRGLLADEDHGYWLSGLAAGLVLLPGISWGQREHVMLILVLPYLAACAVRLNRQRVAHPLLIGALAGLGFSIKPHFLLAPLALELWLTSRTRTIWSGAAAGALVVLAYGVAALVITPEYVPLMWGLSASYSVLNEPLVAMVSRPRSLVVLGSLLFVLVPGEGAQLRRVFAIATAAWWAMAVVQAKDYFFPYHWVPAQAGASSLFLLGLVAISNRLPRGLLAPAAAVVWAVLAVAVPLGRPGKEHFRWYAIADVANRLEGERALALSRALGLAWPAVTYADAEWVYGLPSTWAVDTPEGIDYTLAFTLAALEREPTIVLVTNVVRRDPLPVLLRDPQFRRAWSRYVQTDSVARYRVFRPRPASP